MPENKAKKFCRKYWSMHNVRKKFPIITWIHKYRLKHLQSDVIAGITVGLTVIPQGLAYARIAELPAQYGLYSAFMGCFIYTIFGTSKDITLGPTAIMSLMTADFAHNRVKDDATYAILLTLGCGIVQLFMGLFHLGFLVNFISFPVINGFTSAAAITIAVSQLKTLLGLKDISRDFLHCVYDTARKLPETNYWDLVMGLVCMAVLIILKQVKELKWNDRGEEVPMRKKVARKILWIVGTARNALVVIVAGGVAAALISQDINVLTITGTLKSGLPPFRVPNFTLYVDQNTTLDVGTVFSEIGSGFAVIPLIGLLETIAIGKAFARQNDYKLDANQELVAVGAANIVSSFVGSYPVTGSFSRTAVNSQSGVATPAGGIWTGALVLLALAFLTPLFYYIPDAALAAVIITAVLQMVDFQIIKTLWQIKKSDLIPLVTTFILSFLIGIEYGIMVGVGVSLCMLLYPMARPTITMSGGDSIHMAEMTQVTVNGKRTIHDADNNIAKDHIVVFQPSQGLMFPGVDYLKDKVINEAILSEARKSVIIDCIYIHDIDYSTVQMVNKLYDDFNRHSVILVFANMTADVLDVVKSANSTEFRYADTVDEAHHVIYGILPDAPNGNSSAGKEANGGYDGPYMHVDDESVQAGEDRGENKPAVTPHTSMSVLV